MLDRCNWQKKSILATGCTFGKLRSGPQSTIRVAYQSSNAHRLPLSSNSPFTYRPQLTSERSSLHACSIAATLRRHTSIEVRVGQKASLAVSLNIVAPEFAQSLPMPSTCHT
jgi:hypothetical protein